MARKTSTPKTKVKAPPPVITAAPPQGSDVKNFEIKQPTSEIEIPKSEIPPMEVHHHPEVEKKGIKEYLLEGLMIFVAVTMGFFAESYREHLNDRSKEYEYVANIRKDLVTDTAALNIWIPSMYKRIQQLDSLTAFLEMPGYVKDGPDMYYYARVSTKALKFEASDNTINELKNSDNFRLIRNRELVNNLMDFEKIINTEVNLHEVEQRENEITYPLIGNLFDAAVFDKMIKVVDTADFREKDYEASARLFVYRPAGNPQLRNNNKDEINLLIYYVHQRKSSIFGEARMLKTQSIEATAIINRIDKEYYVR